MKDRIKVIIKEPYAEPYETEIDNTLEALQEIVGGYIEVIGFAEDTLIVLNEEGKLDGLAPNVFFHGDTLVGTIVFIGEDDEYFSDVPDGTLEKINELKVGGMLFIRGGDDE